MHFTEEQRRLLWLSVAEISADKVRRMLEERGSATALWEDFAAGEALTGNAEALRILRRYHHEVALDTLCERIAQKGVQVIFQGDPDYPPLLSCIDDPPYVLYAMGDVTALRRHAVAVVGTRYPSGYGRNMARTIAYGLADAGLCVVSGMARGIDGCAHEGALDAGGTTVAILGSGVNVPYPLENIGIYRKLCEGKGGVLSEYPLDAIPQTYHFPHRNRLISGMCHAAVFVEGRVKSGGMITVDQALRQGREVYAVPGNVGQAGAEGPHQIIRDGARLVTSASDILEDLGLEAKPDLTTPTQEQATMGDTPVQQAVLRALMREPLGMDALCEQTGCTADTMLAELTIMELTGQVRRDSGNIFAIAIGGARP